MNYAAYCIGKGRFNMSYRIVIEMIIKDDEIIFVNISDHDKVY